MVPILLVMLIYLGTWTLSATPSAEVVRLEIRSSRARLPALAATARIYFSRSFAFFYLRRDNVGGNARVRANRLTVIRPRKLRTVESDTCSPLSRIETVSIRSVPLSNTLNSHSAEPRFYSFPFFPLSPQINDANGLKFKQCVYNWWDHSLAIGEVLFLAWGIRVCYSVRNAESMYNEARMISYAIYNIALVNILMIAFQ